MNKGNFGKTLLLVILLLSAVQPLVTGQTLTGSLSFEGVQRDYRVYLPPGYSPGTPAPLVFNLHGLTSDAFQQEFYSGMNAVADTAGFIVCYPNGVNNSWNVGFAGAYNGGVNDVGFISVLLDKLMQDYDIDPSRVYSCGMSNGGFMSYRLACELSHRIAAIASVTGAMTDSMAYFCNPPRAVPVMEVHGTADPTVLYNGLTGTYWSTENSVDFWVQYNQCNAGSPITATLPDINVLDGSTVSTQLWDSCSQGTEVYFMKVQNGGHTWPGAITIPGLGSTNQDFNASQAIWEFFLGHTHPGPATSVSLESRNTFRAYPIPADQFLNIEMEANRGEWKLFDLSGTVVLSGEGSGRVNLEVFPGGMYILEMKSATERTIRKVPVSH